MIDGQWLNASENISDHEGAEKTDIMADDGCGIQLSGLIRVLLVISDWMGSEVYGGEYGKLYSVAIPLYTQVWSSVYYANLGGYGSYVVGCGAHWASALWRQEPLDS